ncbi:hypothetical protein ACIRU8_18580 [Streptomyces sp. NPDC101175]|uniref:hypothetical protein n=1 Tax=Streptomyces sp. NPDC101175 TaxID=3366123 RepID=UPI0038368C9F
MTITAGAPPRLGTPARLVVAFLTGGVIGTSLAAFVCGCVLQKVPLVVAGLALPTGYALLFFLCGLPRRARERAVVPRTALAVIERREAVGGESSDVPVRFELSVVPDDAPAFRVEFRQDVNLVELPDYRPRGIVVVEYRPDRPWRTRIVKRPTPEWEERAAVARLDSVPGPAMNCDPVESGAGDLLFLFGLLLGAAAVVLLLRADLFDADDKAAPPTPSVSSSSSSTTTTMTSATGTVTLGPGQSMLDRGQLRAAVESLTQAADKRRALTVVVQDRTLTVVFSPTGVRTSGFDLRSIPYDRVPALVENARTTLDVPAPRNWQLTADGLTGAVTLRVVVTGGGHAGTLEADGRGKVLRRDGS